MTAPVPRVGEVLPPTLAQVRKWTGVSSTSIDDAELQSVMDAELENQSKACRRVDRATGAVRPYTADLYQAVLRRCARHLATRGIPLGQTPGSDEFGPTRLSSFDAEIERLEGYDRGFWFG
jgi:hypothetical protein